MPEINAPQTRTRAETLLRQVTFDDRTRRVIDNLDNWKLDYEEYGTDDNRWTEWVNWIDSLTDTELVTVWLTNVGEYLCKRDDVVTAYPHTDNGGEIVDTEFKKLCDNTDQPTYTI